MSPANGRATIALLVPGLADGGGVPAVARFVRDTALRSGRYDVRAISLATSSADACHARVLRPWTWIRGATTAPGHWEGAPFVHVGAVAGEIEARRYRPRAALARAVEGCSLFQVVCGSPAWACAVLGLGRPVSVQCATRARVERRLQLSRTGGPLSWWRRWMTRLTDRLDDRALRGADAIQVENPWMLDYAKSLNAGRAVDLRYAPPGVDARKFSPVEQRTPGPGSPILCVGRLDDVRKNVGLLLEACARIPETERGDLQVVLAGQAGPPDTFWRRAEALGLRSRIEFVHRPSEERLVALYRGAGMFVLPSDEEGLGVVLLEAMACGIPPVSTRSGGPDGIITDGEDGFLVPRDDADALAERIRRLRGNPALNLDMGRKARATIENRYAEEVAGKPFLETWDRLLERPGGP